MGEIPPGKARRKKDYAHLLVDPQLGAYFDKKIKKVLEEPDNKAMIRLIKKANAWDAHKKVCPDAKKH